MSDPLGPYDGRVPLVASVDTPAPPWAWLPDESTLRPLTSDARWGNFPGTLTDGGRHYVFAGSDRPGDDTPGPLAGNRVYVRSFATAEVHRVDFTSRPGACGVLRPAAAPDGTGIAIAELWIDETETNPYDTSRTSLWIGSTAEGTGREVLTLHGVPFHASDDGTPLQWSPDGSLIALSTSGSPGRYSGGIVTIVDAATGAVVRRCEGCALAGSVSWSPDGTRLLVTDATNAISDLYVRTGLVAPTACWPERLELDGDADEARPLGYADDTHLLLAHHRGRHLTISVADPTNGTLHPRLKLGPARHIYPVVARMPDGFWT